MPDRRDELIAQLQAENEILRKRCEHIQDGGILSLEMQQDRNERDQSRIDDLVAEGIRLDKERIAELEERLKWQSAESIPTERQILVDVGYPWCHVAVWDEASESFVIANALVSSAGEAEQSRWGQTHIERSKIKGWMEMPLIDEHFDKSMDWMKRVGKSAWGNTQNIEKECRLLRGNDDD